MTGRDKDTAESRYRVSEDDAATRDDNTQKAVLYSVEDTPPWYLCLLLGFQVFIYMYIYLF